MPNPNVLACQGLLADAHARRRKTMRLVKERAGPFVVPAGRVEERRGIASATRFPSPLIERSVQISCTKCGRPHFAERFKLGGAAHMRSCCDTQVEGRAGKLKTDWTNPLAPAVVLRLFYGH